MHSLLRLGARVAGWLLLTCLGCATGVTSDLDEGQGNEGLTGAGDAGQGAGGAGQGGSGHGAGG
ncbi:MAG: hypothetical protein HY744_33640, partial [Deltaproteobacteria bacterium]|nr:hypothetical protein [Deltaproteobacteria bacterium]